jgi:hypothetical protein
MVVSTSLAQSNLQKEDVGKFLQVEEVMLLLQVHRANLLQVLASINQLGLTRMTTTVENLI